MKSLKPSTDVIPNALRKITSDSQEERFKAYDVLDDWLNSLDADIPETYGKLSSIFASADSVNAIRSLIKNIQPNNDGIALILEILDDIAYNIKLHQDSISSLPFALEAQQLIDDTKPLYSAFLEHQESNVRKMAAQLIKTLS